MRAIAGLAPGERLSDEIDAQQEPGDEQPSHPLDSDHMRREHRKLLEWWYLEREKQSANRLEMAIDVDFYDNNQWDSEDAATVEDRGQMPLVYNEVAPAVDWLIGTERRTRADWKVLPRTEDDVTGADVKTKFLKYLSDVNRVPFVRSRAFSDALKAGVGWIDDGVQDDPTKEVLYSKHEDWRNVLWDSAGYDLDLSDARYVFRWRWVDEDIALAMFPGRESVIRSAVDDVGAYDGEQDDEDLWYLGDPIRENRSGIIRTSGVSVSLEARRRRVKLIECQYRRPTQVHVVTEGPWRGTIIPDFDGQESVSSVPRVMMRVHFAVFTETALLAWAPSKLRHNEFTLTPIWCYRRGRDRMPYGVIRRVRDVQRDINKRASKALWLSNTNQIIGDDGAVADWDEAREEASRPDGVIVKRTGKEFEIRRDYQGASAQVEMMTLSAQSVQKAIGVNNENLGRATNAVSGAAIEARQNQGAVGTTEPFDNLRLAIQVQGEKQLSLAEQFVSEERVVRITGANEKLDWLRINEPQMQPDGTWRYLNDLTASRADFVVSEQDYSGTLRQVMAESLNQLAQKLPPESALRVLTIGLQFSDLPNKGEIVAALRRETGDRDPNKPMTPEDEQAEAARGEAMQMQREQSLLALEEQRAHVREINAKAAQMEAEAVAYGNEGAVNAAVNARRLAADELDAMAEELRKLQAELADRSSGERTQIEKARIQADAAIRMKEIEIASKERLAAIAASIESNNDQSRRG
ncbi:hypothetical protein [Accumulibacter sp.]|uniref:portal protein n=1 Tax=Accumulibacter sp. TaxID=2053492 RepID=UPI0025C65822|nr:hypothetical protein [Accumulibacter sp.]